MRIDHVSFVENEMSEFKKVIIPEQGFANLLFLNVEINGKTFIGMFDTGASMTAMKQSLFDELDIKEEQETIIAGNNTGTILHPKAAIIPSLKIGKFETKNNLAMVLENEAFSFGTDENGRSFPADLLIGWDIISKYSWQCDMTKKLLFVKEGGSLPKAEDIVWNNFPLVHATWGNHGFIAGLDTGHTETILTKLWKKRLDVLAFREEEIYGIGSSKIMKQQYTKQFEFKYDTLNISLYNIDIFEQIYGAPSEMEALFGIDILENKKWELDFLSRRFKIGK